MSVDIQDKNFPQTDTPYTNIQKLQIKLAELDEIIIALRNEQEDSIFKSLKEMNPLHVFYAQALLSNKLEIFYQFAAEIIHEINNPMMWIFANLDFINENLNKLRIVDNHDKPLHVEMHKAIAEALAGCEKIKNALKTVKECVTPFHITEILEQKEQTPPAQVTHKRILVIDDEPTLLTVIKRILENKHHVVTFQNSREALAAVTEPGAHFDLIITDLHMPDIGGEALYNIVKKQNPRLAKNFIFITGESCYGIRMPFILENESRCLEKPFTSEQLLEKINAVYQT